MAYFHDNMPTTILALPDELPDDIDAIIQYNDGVHYQLVLKRQGMKIIGHKNSKPGVRYEFDSGGVLEIEAVLGIRFTPSPVANDGMPKVEL